MQELVHADIFFFVTTIVVGVTGVAVAISSYYVVGILRDARAVAKKIRKASDELERDFEGLRASIKSEGLRARSVVDLALAFFARQLPKARVKKKSAEPPAKTD